MAGPSRFPFPKHVWTPYGGHWNHPRTWGRYTALTAMGGWALAAVTVAVVHSKTKIYDIHNQSGVTAPPEPKA